MLACSEIGSLLKEKTLECGILVFSFSRPAISGLILKIITKYDFDINQQTRYHLVHLSFVSCSNEFLMMRNPRG